MGAHELAFIGLAGSGIGTALGVPMVWPRVRRPVDVRLLGATLLFTSAIAALISARLAGLAPASTPVEHAINGLGLTALPIVLLYTRYATAAPVTRTVVGWCLTPAALYAGYVAACAAVGAGSRVPFIWLLPVAVGFTVASAVTLWIRRAARRPALVPPESVVAFAAVINAAQIVRMEFGHLPLARPVVPLVLSLGFLVMAAYAAWRSVGIAAAPPSNTVRATAPDAATAAPRYERSGLEEAGAPDLLERIDRALTDNRLFARPDLTLAQLAAAAAATPHQVSEALNRYAGQSFHDLINRRRVDDVKAQLLDPVSDRYTIEGIGASAGFGSRSALYAAFRRLEGMTPTAFRARHRRPPPDGNEPDRPTAPRSDS